VVPSVGIRRRDLGKVGQLELIDCSSERMIDREKLLDGFLSSVGCPPSTGCGWVTKMHPSPFDRFGQTRRLEAGFSPIHGGHMSKRAGSGSISTAK
jgi:hypothetical protein